MLQNNVKLTDKGFAVGRRAENIVTEVTFDITELIEVYGTGTAVLMFKRPYDENAYPVTVEQSGNTVTWTPTNTDLYYDGTGAAELFWYLENDALAKSIVWRVFVARDIGAASGNPPEPYDDWVETLTALGAETLENAQAAQAAQGAAEFAQGKAEDAQEAAETAQGKAEDAQGFAEEASTAAGNSAADADRSEGEAAAWATGSYSGDGGMPVPPTAPQHHNNAKYYSEQAEAALEQFTTPTASASTLPAGSSATASYSDGNFAFGIPKGDKGDTGNPGATGPAAGFGEVSATVDGNVGTPSVEVSASGPDTAKEFAFAFHNLKGEQGEQGDPGEVSEADLAAAIDKVAIKDIATGAIASFPDGADGMPLKSVVIDIEPVQDLHGYDHPWPAGGGKNKLNVDSVAMSSNGYLLNLSGLSIPAGTYTISIKASALANVSGASFAFQNSGGTSVISSIGNAIDVFSTGCTVTLSDTCAIIKLYVTLNGDTTFTEFQLENGSAKTSYASYSNICPISGWTGAKVTAAGKNIYDVASYPLTEGRYINHNTGAIATADAFDCTLDYIPISPAFIGQTMKWNCENHGGSAPGLAWYDAQKVYISGAQVFPSVVPQGAAFLRFTVKHGQSNIMLYFGDVPISYEPYHGATKPISFPSTIYGGTDEVVSGTGVSNMALIDLGTVEWEYNTTTLNVPVFKTKYNLPNGILDKNTEFVCSEYKFVGGRTYLESNDMAFARWNNGGAASILAVRDTRYTDAATFKTAMSGVQVCYEVSNPSDFTTEPVNITSLYGRNNIWADTGDVEVEYRADTKLYINKIVGALA